MARKSAKKASPKRATPSKRSAPRPAAKKPKRDARKAPTRKAPARKAADRKPKAARGKAKPAKGARRASTRAGHLSTARKQEILQTVARPRKGEHADQERPLETAAHEHADPRLLAVQSGNPGAAGGHNTDFGAYKNKAVARLDRPQNWFRKAPKAPEK